MQLTCWVIFQEAFQYLYVARDLLPISCHRWIRTLSWSKTLQIGNPEVFFNKLITAVGFAFVGELSSAHRGYFDKGLFIVSKPGEDARRGR